jgi:glycosyltransferase involved in cell wall biosynthesis
MAGGDDMAFTKDWDLAFLEYFKNEKINVIGGVDAWLVSKSGLHTSFPCVRRKYIDEIGSAWGMTGVFYPPQMEHYMLDNELEQLAWARNCIKLNRDVVIHHNHPAVGLGEWDETYKKSSPLLVKDREEFHKRYVNYEWWDYKQADQGKAVPSQFRRKRLSIILPVYNCKELTIKTIQSLCKMTKNKWELVLIGAGSTQFDDKEVLPELQKLAYEGGFTTVLTYVAKDHFWCNDSWNKAYSMASGDYLAFVNNDLEIKTVNWDELLINDLQRNDLTSGVGDDHVTNSITKGYRITGCFFMMRRDYADRVFPIPFKYRHYFGDCYFAHETQQKVINNSVQIHHYEKQAGRSMNQEEYFNFVIKDCEAWAQETGDNKPLESTKSELDFIRLNKNTKISIVLPIYNCRDLTLETVSSMIAKTANRYEFILIDDNSTEFDGKEFLKELKTMIEGAGWQNVITISNKDQLFCNGNWNKGAKLAKGDYIAFINNDITVASNGYWDAKIIPMLSKFSVVSPFLYKTDYCPRPYGILHKGDVPIRGCFFVMTKKSVKEIFPIPAKYKHWYGDNYICQKTGGMDSVQNEQRTFTDQVFVTHGIAKASGTVNQLKYWQTIVADAEAWAKETGDEKNLERCRHRLFIAQKQAEAK